MDGPRHGKGPATGIVDLGPGFSVRGTVNREGISVSHQLKPTGHTRGHLGLGTAPRIFGPGFQVPGENRKHIRIAIFSRQRPIGDRAHRAGGLYSLAHHQPDLRTRPTIKAGDLGGQLEVASLWERRVGKMHLVLLLAWPGASPRDDIGSIRISGHPCGRISDIDR